MEQIAPRLANAGKILTALSIIVTATNLKLDLLKNPGITTEEYVGLGLAAVFLIISIISSKERKIPTLSDSPTLEEQLAAMEETPTKSSTTNVSNQIEQMREVPKKLDEYTKEEVEEFPRVWDPPKDYLVH